MKDGLRHNQKTVKNLRRQPARLGVTTKGTAAKFRWSGPKSGIRHPSL
jgi:hypothetical protein